MAKKTTPQATKAAPKRKQTATSKETGGGGGIFEEQVIAYFLTDLLTGRAPFAVPEGKVERADTQRPAGLWPLDDLLLTLEATGQSHRVAFSIKSNAQFTAQGFPADFVRAAWEQLLTTSVDLFDPASDYLGFVTVPVDPAYARDVEDLLNRARQQDPATLDQEINLKKRANERVRTLYRSFACPPDLAAQYPGAATLAGRALARLVWLPMDFEQPQSRDARDCRDRLQGALVSGQATEAADLWLALQLVARAMRPHAGDRTLPKLADELRHKFALTAFPEHRLDWQRLREEAENAAQQVPARIGGHLLLPRAAERASLSAALQSSRAVVLRGASGVGKSVLASLELLDRAGRPPEPVLWLDAEGLRGKTLASLQRDLNLTASLSTLLPGTTAARALCVLDRLDKVYDQSTLGLIAAVLRLLRLDDPASPWQLLLPCVGEEWERVRASLLQQGFALQLFRVVEVGVPGPTEREQVWQQFPSLAPLQLRPHLNEVLLRPKMLDILARSLTLGSLPDDVVGEVSVAERWLASLSEQGGTVKQLLYARQMATTQADTWQNSLPVGELPPLNSEAVEELIGQRVCVRRTGRIAFEHDLYGDWLRLAQLQQEAAAGRLLAFVTAERLRSPLWQRALRLYGVSLLDGPAGTAGWEQAATQLAPLGEVASDLLLDATWYATDVIDHLLALWPRLVADEGALLRRLLVRFHLTATRPNDLMLQALPTDDPALLLQAATWHRLPELGYWPPVLVLLYAQRHELPLTTARVAAEVVLTWLRFLPVGTPLREEAAAVAVALGEALLRYEQAGNWARGLGQQVWPAVLAAAPEEPAEVAQLTLEAAGRRPQRFLPPPDPAAEHPRRKSLNFEGPVRPQWPTGPARRVDSDLQQAALDHHGLLPLLKTDAAAALELALALLIEEPTEPSASLDLNYGLERLRQWQGDYFANGPFLLFWQQREDVGLALLLELERRALAGLEEEETRRAWRWGTEPGQAPPPPFTLPTVVLDLPEGERAYPGTADVYGWHRGEHPSSSTLASALMALEKYLYDRLDAGDDITPLLQKLLAQAGSVAVLGTLTMVGKYRPGLLEGVLQPLLGSPELQQWDYQLNLRLALSGDWLGAINSPQRREELRVWQQLPHRRLSLLVMAQHYFHQSEDGSAFFAAARQRWATRAAISAEPAHYAQSLHYFDPANHTREQVGPQEVVTYQEPEARREAREVMEARQPLELILLSVVTKRRLLDTADADPLPEQQPAQLGQEIDALLEAAATGAAQFFSVGRPADVLAAIAALLLLRGRAWLAQHPTRETWCRQTVLEGARLLWEQRTTDPDEPGVSGLHQTDFLADALPALWAERPADDEVRQAVGQWQLVAPLTALQRFAQRAAGYRTAIGEDFYRAAHLRLLRAAQQDERQRVSGHWVEPADPTATARLAQLDATRDAWLPEFMAGRLRAELPALHTLIASPSSLPSGPEPWAVDRHRPSLVPHPFREPLMVAAFTGLPSPTDDPTWLGFWQRVVADTVARLRPASTERFVEWEDFPREWDSWLLAQVAGWLPLLPPAQARTLWEPVLELGCLAPRWVKEFLEQWWLHLASRPTDPAAQQVWQEMVDAALVSPTWTIRAGRQFRYALGEEWRTLLGLIPLVRWPAGLQPLVASLGERWGRWAASHVGNDDNAAALATFLTKPAARDLTLAGLPWLARPLAYAPASDTYWDDVAESIAHLLAYAWQQAGPQLRQQPLVFESFKALLAMLVTRQHQLGLELNRLVGSS
jgi:hypothetical protein